MKGSHVQQLRVAKTLLLVLFDAATSVFCLWLSYYLRLGTWTSFVLLPIGVMALCSTLAPFCLILFGFYQSIERIHGSQFFNAPAKALLLYASAFATVVTLFGITGVPRTLGFLQPIIFSIALTTTRTITHNIPIYIARVKNKFQGNSRLRIIIYGAGSAGSQLAASLIHSLEYKVVAFVDDDANIEGRTVHGLRIFSSNHLPDLISRYGARTVVLAIPSLTRTKRKEILASLAKLNCAVRTLPNIDELINGKVGSTDLQDLAIEDLIDREEVPPIPELLRADVAGKTVLITGAGGSIGSELCRTALKNECNVLLLLDHSEHALYKIHAELSLKFPSAKLIPLLSDVTRAQRLKEVFEKYRPHTVYHAAAYKHVPLVEQNIFEGVRNNVLGCLLAAKLSLEFGTRKFVLISTDKAVRPTSVMGASKRVCELILQALTDSAQPKSETVFAMVRFGNVLDSSGSVLPLFRKQINAGGPVTITHPEVTRYFMTIPEASQLVFQAGAMATGGDVFLLDMGQPVKIMDLAQKMIELSGLNTQNQNDKEIKIEIVGLRLGEKLHEELLISNSLIKTPHPKIFKAWDKFIKWNLLENKLESLFKIIDSTDSQYLISTLSELVEGYGNPSSLSKDSGATQLSAKKSNSQLKSFTSHA